MLATLISVCVKRFMVIPSCQKFDSSEISAADPGAITRCSQSETGRPSFRGIERAARDLLARALGHIDPGARIIVLGERSGARMGAEEAIVHSSSCDAKALLVLVGWLLGMHLRRCRGGK